MIRTFLWTISIVLLVDSMLQIVCAKYKIPITYAVINGIADIVFAVWGLHLLGIL